MSVTVNLKLRQLENPRLDLTKEMQTAGQMVAAEMRGNVKAGLDVHESPLQPNKPGYAARKMKKLGHARPLIGENRSLVSPASYTVKKLKMNSVRITLPGQHPRGGLSIGQLGYIHNFGLGHNPVRQFAGVTDIAVKRVVAFLADRVSRLMKGVS